MSEKPRKRGEGSPEKVADPSSKRRGGNIDKVIDILAQQILRFWKDKAGEFGYSPEDLYKPADIALSHRYGAQQAMKVYFPIPILSDGRWRAREIEFVIINEYFPFKLKKLLQLLKRIKPPIPGSWVHCSTTFVIAKTLHGRNPPSVAARRARYFMKLDETACYKVGKTIANAVYAHTRAIDSNLQYKIESMKRMLEFSYEFAAKLDSFAGQSSGIPREEKIRRLAAQLLHYYRQHPGEEITLKEAMKNIDVPPNTKASGKIRSEFFELARADPKMVRKSDEQSRSRALFGLKTIFCYRNNGGRGYAR